MHQILIQKNIVMMLMFFYYFVSRIIMTDLDISPNIRYMWPSDNLDITLPY